MTIKKGDEFYVKHEPAGGDNYWMSGPYVCASSDDGIVHFEFDQEDGQRLSTSRTENECVKKEVNDERITD